MRRIWAATAALAIGLPAMASVAMAQSQNYPPPGYDQFPAGTPGTGPQAAPPSQPQDQGPPPAPPPPQGGQYAPPQGGQYAPPQGGQFAAPQGGQPGHLKGRARFDAANTTQDGRLTMAQAQAAHWMVVVRNFAAMDRDNKGYVTWQDIREFMKERRTQRESMGGGGPQGGPPQGGPQGGPPSGPPQGGPPGSGQY